MFHALFARPPPAPGLRLFPPVLLDASPIQCENPQALACLKVNQFAFIGSRSRLIGLQVATTAV